MKANFLITFFIILIVSGFFPGLSHLSDTSEGSGEQNAYISDDSLSSDALAEVDKIFNSLSPEEKVGQLILTHFNGRNLTEDDPRYIRLIHLFKELKIGGGIVYKGEVSEQVILLNRLQGLSKLPLLFSADYERAISSEGGDYFSLPYNMAIGAANDSVKTFLAARELARNARKVGIHHIYAPVVDVNNNSENPVINMRSFGENPDLVSSLSAAFIKGIQAGGCIATAKHFPGHGNTAVDSHVDLPIIRAGYKELEKTEFKPFIASVKAGVGSVMTGHLALPEIDSSNTPASLSPILTFGLLRERLNFKGLIVTDALTMKAVSKRYGSGEAALMAFLAGNDLLLMPEDEDSAYNSLLDALRSGVITEARLDASVRRIIEAKFRLGLFRDRVVEQNIKREEGIFRSISGLRLARNSITLLGNADKVLPLKIVKGKSTLHVVYRQEKNNSAGNIFSEELSKRDTSIKTVIISDLKNKNAIKDVISSARESANVILSVYSRASLLKADDNYLKLRRTFVNSILKSNKKSLLAVHGTPYELEKITGLRNCIINYGETDVSEIALAEAITGEVTINGKLPVTVPKSGFKYGTGLKVLKTSLAATAVQPSEDFTKTFDNLFKSAIADTVFPCASVMLIKKGEVILQKGYGNLTYDKSSAPTEVNTIFDMASVSKVMATTTAAMICIDRKLFSLEDRVNKYIPAFGANGKENVRIKNLLLHNSGLPAYKTYYKMVKTGDEILKDIYSSPLDFVTGTKMTYSDLGMITLGKIIEKVTGKKLDKFCTDEIFKPLGMNSTFYNPPKEYYSRVAPTENDNYWRMRQLVGTVHDENADMLGGVAGHAGLFSTTGDIAILLQMLLQHGSYNGVQYIKPETVKLFTRRHSGLSSRAIGWDTNLDHNSSAGESFSESSYGHLGYTGTSVWTDPEKEVIAILLTNRVYPTRNNIKIGKFRRMFHEAAIKLISELETND